MEKLKAVTYPRSDRAERCVPAVLCSDFLHKPNRIYVTIVRLHTYRQTDVPRIPFI